MIDAALAATNGMMEILIQCDGEAELAFGQAILRGRHRCKAITLRLKASPEPQASAGQEDS
jgi:hypothetical protein